LCFPLNKYSSVAKIPVLATCQSLIFRKKSPANYQTLIVSNQCAC
jgi:hypothetical protein